MVWVACVVGLLVGTPLWFLLLRGPRILDSDPILFTGWITLSGLMLAIWYLLKTTPPDAIKLKPKRSQWVIMLGAVWLHAHAIVWLVPGLSDDVLRYKNDGFYWRELKSPYRFTGKAGFWLWSAADGDLIRVVYMPHPEARSVYMPSSQCVFVLVAYTEECWPLQQVRPWERMTVNRWRDALADASWASTFVHWRLAFGGTMLAATWLLMRCCLRLGRSPWWAVLVGWHPLAIIETSGMAHQDAIGILLLAAAFLAFIPLPLREGLRGGVARLRRAACEIQASPQSTLPLNGGGNELTSPLTTPKAEGMTLEYSTLPVRSYRLREISAGVLLALACGVKPLAILPAAFWFIARPSARWVVPFVITALLLGSVLLYQDGYVGFFETLRTYTQTWEANGSFFHVIRSYPSAIYEINGLYIEPWELARMLGAIIVCGVSIGLIRKRAHWTTAFYWIVLTILLVAPVVYPWYLLWLMVIIPLLNPRWGLAGLVFAATVTFNYRLWHEPEWVLPWSWLAAEYIPVYVALVVELFVSRRRIQP